jgi:hypothetical protein
MLSCEQLIAFYEDEVFDPCLDQFAALENACGPGCLMSGLMGPNDCSLARVCGAVTQDYQCTGETCTCVENDVPGANCASAGFCELTTDAQTAAANACCGWDWP